MQEVRGSKLRLGGLGVSQLQASGGKGALQSRFHLDHTNSYTPEQKTTKQSKPMKHNYSPESKANKIIKSAAQGKPGSTLAKFYEAAEGCAEDWRRSIV